MFRNLLAIALVTSLLLIRSRAGHCRPRAISLPFKGERLDNRIGLRGIGLGVGLPRQKFSLVLCAAHVDTYLYDPSAPCGPGMSPYACLNARGGAYNPSLSSSAKAGDPLNHIMDYDGTTKYQKDVIVFNNDVTSPIQDYDFSVLNKQMYESRIQGFVGVGASSSLIQALQRVDAVSSISYSFYWGGELADESRDGFVTFGGFDHSIMDGTAKVTKAFNRSFPACAEGMIVELTGMRLSNEYGAFANIFDGLGTMRVCVVPSMRNIMALPKAYGDRIIKGMGGQRADDYLNGKFGGTLPNTAVITPESATFRGNLSITIENAVTINFTAEQLLLEETYFDSDGFIERNSSLRNIPLVIEDPALMPRLGGMFFSSAYLIVNHDKSEFSIASVRATRNQSSLEGIDTKNNCAAPVNGDMSNASPSSSNSSTESNTRSLTSSAIAGIVSGTIIGFGLALGTAVVIRRRTRAVGHSQKVTQESTVNVYEVPEDTSTHELCADWRLRIAELDGRLCP